MRCRDCQGAYLYPRLREPDMLAHYRRSEYYKGGDYGYQDYMAQERSLRITFRTLLKRMQQQGLTGGNLLEVGCGQGFLLDEARPYFQHRVGLEFSPSAVEKAREMADEVYLGGVEALPPEDLFDCIMATQVIEHVYAPETFLSVLVARLKAGGCLLLSTPDTGGLVHGLTGARWPSLKAPEHVVYYDVASLSRLMKACGLVKVGKFPYSETFPLATITEKFGFRPPGFLARLVIKIPGASFACVGFKGGERSGYRGSR